MGHEAFNRIFVFCISTLRSQLPRLTAGDIFEGVRTKSVNVAEQARSRAALCGTWQALKPISMESRFLQDERGIYASWRQIGCGSVCAGCTVAPFSCGAKVVSAGTTLGKHALRILRFFFFGRHTMLLVEPIHCASFSYFC